MTVVIVASAIVLLLVVDFLILAGKLDFLMGRSLKLEVYGSLPRDKGIFYDSGDYISHLAICL